jgi:hypothetical protein
VHWRDIIKFLQSWEGIASASVAASAAIYYAPKQWLETWDWYMDRFHDYKVYELIKLRRTVSSSDHARGRIKYGRRDYPWKVEDIATKLERSDESVRESLRRLERREKVKENDWGWFGWELQEPVWEKDEPDEILRSKPTL